MLNRSVKEDVLGRLTDISPGTIRSQWDISDDACLFLSGGNDFLNAGWWGSVAPAQPPRFHHEAAAKNEHFSDGMDAFPLFMPVLTTRNPKRVLLPNPNAT